MGNASNLRKNPTWSTIIDEMEKRGQIGPGFPIACGRHPDQVKMISAPGQLPKVAPLGMSKNYYSTPRSHSDRWLSAFMRVQAFLRTYLLIIGKNALHFILHILTFPTPTQCHTDLDNHKSTVCYEKCMRLVCVRQHPCVRPCYQSCDGCEFLISNVTLPCGHAEEQVLW
jgi:hypothetical protein